VIVTLTEKIKFYEDVFGPGKLARNSANFDVRCTICDPKDHSKKKLAIHVDDDRVHCWVCGYKAHTLAPLIRKRGTREQLNQYRDRFMPETASHRTRCIWFNVDEPEVEDAQPQRLPEDFRLLATLTTRDPDVLAVKNYLASRKVTVDDMWFFKLGYSDVPPFNRRVIMPSFDATGVLNYYSARTVDKTRRPKYEVPERKRNEIIFNEINIDWTQRLVLCEGIFDLMKCGSNAVPLLGSDINEESALFNSIAVNGTPIALALDADMRYTKVPFVAKKLANYNIDVVIVQVPTDPGDLSKEAFQEALNVAQQFDWDRMFLDRLEYASRMKL